ncbi:MAG: TIGR03915 family putative DNA repair protein [Clostridiales bacterium]|jgi:probable DNA metabolism protein|nr:TIGR03915 family putative DNA repair protein [Clostridiales bacterium]
MSGYVVLFDGSLDGLLCAVYAYYYDKILPLSIQTEDEYQPMLGAENYFVASDPEKAKRVWEGIRKKISPGAAYNVYTAFLSGEVEKHMAIFKYIVLGFKRGASVDNRLQEDCVLRVHKLARMTGYEAHMLSGFCRFAETKQGAYYCAISPKHRVLQLLAEHFRDRFMNHAWVIHDKKRGEAAVYDGNDYVIVDAPKDAAVEYSDDETRARDMWAAFFSTIAIKERVNKNAQRRHAALYFRANMLEFL